MRHSLRDAIRRIRCGGRAGHVIREDCMHLTPKPNVRSFSRTGDRPVDLQIDAVTSTTVIYSDSEFSI
jgi:hypothetical protein